jgi:hypothetical protein
MLLSERYGSNSTVRASFPRVCVSIYVSIGQSLPHRSTHRYQQGQCTGHVCLSVCSVCLLARDTSASRKNASLEFQHTPPPHTWASIQVPSHHKAAAGVASLKTSAVALGVGVGVRRAVSAAGAASTSVRPSNSGNSRHAPRRAGHVCLSV